VALCKGQSTPCIVTPSGPVIKSTARQRNNLAGFCTQVRSVKITEFGGVKKKVLLGMLETKKKILEKITQ
jgi:hypothetical protein